MGTSAATSSAPDLLVFSDSNPGDDAQINEQKRIIAQLDLARPEMIINAWVIQNSSTNPEAIGAFSGMVRDIINEANNSLEAVILGGELDFAGGLEVGTLRFLRHLEIFFLTLAPLFTAVE